MVHQQLWLTCKFVHEAPAHSQFIYEAYLRPFLTKLEYSFSYCLISSTRRRRKLGAPILAFTPTSLFRE